MGGTSPSLHKRGVDVENALWDCTRMKRMNRQDVELLLGGGDGESEVFTWLEKRGRTVGPDSSVPLRFCTSFRI
jgi:hypothetical protein